MQVEELPDGGIKCTMSVDMPKWVEDLSDDERERFEELFQAEWDKAVKEQMKRVFGDGIGMMTPLEDK